MGKKGFGGHLRIMVLGASYLNPCVRGLWAFAGAGRSSLCIIGAEKDQFVYNWCVSKSLYCVYAVHNSSNEIARSTIIVWTLLQAQFLDNNVWRQDQISMTCVSLFSCVSVLHSQLWPRTSQCCLHLRLHEQRVCRRRYRQTMSGWLRDSVMVNPIDIQVYASHARRDWY